MQGAKGHNSTARSRALGQLALATLVCALSGPCRAEAIQQRLANGLVANAEYHHGSGKQAVLVLHGLLATHHFPTIQSIVGELRDNGYTVLAPTLTLGINDRKTSLPCNALHLHTMAQTVQELGWWVNWLAAQGNDDISLVGHSAGSVQVLAYTQGDPHPVVRRQVLTSLVPLERLPGTEPAGAGAAQARQWRAAGDRHIARYDLSFCHGNFSAPPEVYLSYRAWDKQRVLEALRKTRLTTTVIMGGNDDRFTGDTWMSALHKDVPNLVVLPTANHFFDGMAEFALLDSIDAALGRGAQGGAVP